MSSVRPSTAQFDLLSTAPATSSGCGRKRVAGGHADGGHALEAAEHLLVLQLLVGEPDQRFERDLVAERVVAAELGGLGADEALDQGEHVGVGAALDLRQQARLGRLQEGELVDLRQAVGQELLAEVEAAAADDVAVDVPADALGRLDAAGVAVDVLRLGGGGNGVGDGSVHGGDAFVVVVGREDSGAQVVGQLGADVGDLGLAADLGGDAADLRAVQAEVAQGAVVERMQRRGGRPAQAAGGARRRSGGDRAAIRRGEDGPAAGGAGRRRV